jgi:hypothetical protein
MQRPAAGKGRKNIGLRPAAAKIAACLKKISSVKIRF